MFLHHKIIPWADLTTSSHKRKYFSSDFYFELSYEAALQTIKTEISSRLKNYTLLFIKPEAFITNKIDILINDLKKHHFELVYVSVKHISHVQISELWKYMWSGATLTRIIVNQAYYTKYKCGILILQNTDYTGHDLCAFLSQIKGSTSKGPYKNPDIRYHMDSINTFLNHIHSPDEIADFMRETAVFCDWNELIEIYNKILTKETINFDILRDFADKYPISENSISPELAMQTLLQKISKEIQVSIQDSQKSALTNIYNKLLLVQSNKALFTNELLEEMQQANVLVWDWPMFILITTYMDYFTDCQTLI